MTSYEINELLASPYTYTYGRNSVSYIVVHYTATQASAYNNCVYFSGGNRNASAHYFIDDDSIWRSVPESSTAWHAGNWWMNQNSIGIEVVSDGRDFSEGEIDRLGWLVRDLMERYGLGADSVIRHYDVADIAGWSDTLDPHKSCPAPYIDWGKWAALHARITSDPAPAPHQEPGEAVNDAGMWYRLHVQDLGWLDAVHDGQTAGTTGFGLRGEAFKITPPDGMVLDVKVHIQDEGWKTYCGVQKGVYDPEMGTTGQCKRLECIELDVVSNPHELKVSYQVHIADFGWTGCVDAGYACGTVGCGKAIEAIRIKAE